MNRGVYEIIRHSHFFKNIVPIDKLYIFIKAKYMVLAHDDFYNLYDDKFLQMKTTDLFTNKTIPYEWRFPGGKLQLLKLVRSSTLRIVEDDITIVKLMLVGDG